MHIALHKLLVSVPSRALTSRDSHRGLQKYIASQTCIARFGELRLLPTGRRDRRISKTPRPRPGDHQTCLQAILPDICGSSAVDMHTFEVSNHEWQFASRSNRLPIAALPNRTIRVALRAFFFESAPGIWSKGIPYPLQAPKRDFFGGVN